MVDISEGSVFSPVTRIETNTVALGGDEVNSPNLQFKQLSDRDNWLKDQIEAITGAGDINVLALEVSQVAHGLSVKDPVYHNGTIWVKSNATNSDTAMAIGIVTEVPTSDSFKLSVGRCVGLSGLVGGKTYYLQNGGGIGTTPGNVQRAVFQATSSTTGWFNPVYDFPTVESPFEIGGRLTLTTNTPVLTTSVTSSATLYYTPYISNRVTVWDSARGHWKRVVFSELSITLVGLPGNTNYDVFLTENAAALELVVWSSSTQGASTRASALTYKDGVRVKAADNRRFLGTIRTISAGGAACFTCSDQQNQQYFVWNESNRIKYTPRNWDETNHTFSGSVRNWNANTNNRIEFLIGETIVNLFVVALGWLGPENSTVEINVNNTGWATGVYHSNALAGSGTDAIQTERYVEATFGEGFHTARLGQDAIGGSTNFQRGLLYIDGGLFF